MTHQIYGGHGGDPSNIPYFTHTLPCVGFDQQCIPADGTQYPFAQAIPWIDPNGTVYSCDADYLYIETPWPAANPLPVTWPPVQYTNTFDSQHIAPDNALALQTATPPVNTAQHVPRSFHAMSGEPAASLVSEWPTFLPAPPVTPTTLRHAHVEPPPTATAGARLLDEYLDIPPTASSIAKTRNHVPVSPSPGSALPVDLATPIPYKQAVAPKKRKRGVYDLDVEARKLLTRFEEDATGLLARADEDDDASLTLRSTLQAVLDTLGMNGGDSSTVPFTPLSQPPTTTSTPARAFSLPLALSVGLPTESTSATASNAPSASATPTALQLPRALIMKGGWKPIEVERLEMLVKESSARLKRERTAGSAGSASRAAAAESQDEDEADLYPLVDWDWVCGEMGVARTRHQILLKATQMGFKRSSKDQPRRNFKVKRENRSKRGVQAVMQSDSFGWDS